MEGGGTKGGGDTSLWKGFCGLVNLSPSLPQACAADELACRFTPLSAKWLSREKQHWAAGETHQLTEPAANSRRAWEHLENLEQQHEEEVSHACQAGPGQHPGGHGPESLQPEALSTYCPWPQDPRQGRPTQCL